MLALASPTVSQNQAVVGAREASAPSRDLVTQPRPPATASQDLPMPALDRFETPFPAEAPGPNIGLWLNAAVHGSPFGFVVCNSAEQVVKLMHLATRGSKAFVGEAALDESERSLLTLLFTDIVESTRMVERLGDAAWQRLMARHHAIVRRQLTAFGGWEIDHAGDGFFAAFDRPGAAVCCAEAIRAALEDIGIAIRAGVHAGECQTGGGLVTGVAVHVAARVASIAQPGEVLASSALRDLVAGSGLEFSDRDWHTLKGLSGTRQLFALNRESVALYVGATRQRQTIRLQSEAGFRVDSPSRGADIALVS